MISSQKKPCWDGKNWLGINKCVRFGTKKDPENFIPDFFSTQRYSLAFPTPDQVERGVYQYHLRVMVEDPRRSGWRVTDGAKPRPDGGTDTTSASGLRGKDWRKYMEKRKAMCMDAGDPITPFDELEKDNVKLAEHLRKRHCREAMSSWLPFFKMLSSKDKEGADAFDVTVSGERHLSVPCCVDLCRSFRTCFRW